MVRRPRDSPSVYGSGRDTSSSSRRSSVRRATSASHSSPFINQGNSEVIHESPRWKAAAAINLKLAIETRVGENGRWYLRFD